MILELLSLCVKRLLFQNRLEEYSGAKSLGDIHKEAPWSREAGQRDSLKETDCEIPAPSTHLLKRHRTAPGETQRLPPPPGP